MTESSTRRPSIVATPIVAVIAGIFGLFFAYAVWAGVSNLVATTSALQPLGLSITASTWGVLVLMIVVPIAAFVVAVLLGRRRGFSGLVLLLIVGLTITAVFWMNAQGYLLSATLVTDPVAFA